MQTAQAVGGQDALAPDRLPLTVYGTPSSIAALAFA
jgi:hypothetical protein